jgi:hypothetical protein
MIRPILLQGNRQPECVLSMLPADLYGRIIEDYVTVTQQATRSRLEVGMRLRKRKSSL